MVVDESHVIACVGGVVLDGNRRILLVRRGHAPSLGLWSVPGGRIEQGESDAAAVIREVAEETGLDCRVIRYLGTVRRPAPERAVFDIRDYLLAVLDTAQVGASKEPVAGDDAAEVRWVTRQEMLRLPLVPGLVDALQAWSALPGDAEP